MDRRTYLTALGAVGLAGCAGGAESTDTETATPPDTATSTLGDQGEDDETPTASPTDTPTETPTETASPTPEASVSLELGDPEFVTVDLGYYSGPAAEVPVENTGSAPSSEVWVTFDWFDENDEYLDSFSMSCASIGAGETWAARAYPDGVDASVEGVEVGFRDAGSATTFAPDGVELVDSTFRASSETVLLRGTAENARESELRYLAAVGKVYGEDGTLFAADYTNETEIQSGATWSFEMEPWTVGRNGAAASGDALLTTTL